MEDAEVHSKVFTSKKKTMTMKQIRTKLTGLKKNEKIFFRSQSKWSKGDPLTNQTANDYGHLYVSNLSVMFSGYNRSTRINFTRIVEIEKYEDLISIKKRQVIMIISHFLLKAPNISYYFIKIEKK